MPGSYASTYDVKDCFKSGKYQAGFKPDSLKANYIMKGVRIWRSISLENKQNESLLNSSSNCTEIGLFEIIKFGVFEKQLHVFSSDNFNETKFSVLTKADVYKLVTISDSVSIPTFNTNGEQVMEVSNVKKYRMGSDIKSYLIKEDWITNSYTGKTEKYIIGIAPLVYDLKREKTIPLFWLYYPEWKSFLSAFPAKNFYSYEPISFEEVFRKRYFISQISKESNVFDRSLKSIYHGDDVYLESELIKEKLNNAESDLFQH